MSSIFFPIKENRKKSKLQRNSSFNYENNIFQLFMKNKRKLQDELFQKEEAQCNKKCFYIPLDHPQLSLKKKDSLMFQQKYEFTGQHVTLNYNYIFL